MVSLIDDDDGEFLIGRLLVAMPGIDDPRFERTVLYLCAHDEEAAMGLAVNRPVEGLTVFELLNRLGVRSDIQAPSDLVLLGGPLERERGFVLHTDDFNSPDSTLAVADGVALTATRDALDAMASAYKRPRKSLLALGYAGWGPGQLEQELRDNVWLICDADEGLLFDEDHDHKWTRALAKLGITADHLSATAGRA
ncbi:putative transcriptional regulator [Caulobacter sp. BE264]|jgi:putative transcriptional regulator|uniref:YqgE/AlgH family protein n=1 Tax=Caulobacter sp. BE264 TaxID=2817724 RepID=UPI0028627A98|nr:YqgE/AlgH family protein [Caulobacter sp. BE264]MDR7231646.1 putative transcriptional regulator [Caulobacter sp. BE264]